jgi:hypothetical protein
MSSRRTPDLKVMRMKALRLRLYQCPKREKNLESHRLNDRLNDRRNALYTP